MRRRFACRTLTLLVILGQALPAQQTAPAPAGFGEVIEVNVVNVDVSVTDKAGRPVTGLGKRDFELSEDGRRVEITHFEAIDRRPSSPRTGASPGEESAVPTLEESLHLVVYVDNLNIRPAHRTRALQSLKEFLARETTLRNRVMLVTFDGGALHVRQPFTSDAAALAAILDGMSGLAVRGEADDLARRQAFQAMMSIQEVSLAEIPPLPCPQNIVTPAQGYASSRRQEVLQTLGALTLLVNSLSGVPGRKALLHVSDGIPVRPGEELFQFLYEVCGGGGVTAGIGNVPMPSEGVVQTRGRVREEELSPNALYDSRSLGPESYQAASQAASDAQVYDITRNLEALAAHANAQRVTLYTLQASGLQAPGGSDAAFGPHERLFQFPSIATLERMNHRSSLQTLAAATGGRAILDANDLLPELARMREDFDVSYSLGYTPAHTGDGREHQIKVQVKRPGLQVRHRSTYRDKPALERTVDRTLAALFYGFEDNPLEIALEIGAQTPAGEGRYAVPVQLRIPLFKLGILKREESFEGKLRLLVTTRAEDGSTSPVRQVEVPLRIPRGEVLTAMGQYYLYTLTLNLPPGVQRLAVAVRDEFTTTTSFLSRQVEVGGPQDGSPVSQGSVIGSEGEAE